MVKRVEIIGDYKSDFRPHQATDAALCHAQTATGLELLIRWLSTDELDKPDGMDRLRRAHGVLVAPGSPYNNMNGVLAAIRLAREAVIPLLATCGGFQHVILEYARNVLGFNDDQHAEYDPYASRLIISKLTCSLVGRSLPITLVPGSATARIYGQAQIEEQYYCNFGVNPEHVLLLRSSRLQIVGSDPEGEARVVELADHPFFIGTLYVPQLRSSETKPHPLLVSLLAAARNRENPHDCR
jgi:CTP synthase (UTP-ammonia lyase)